jgi:GNAT superfamily N-acetyltransferase
VRCSVFLLTGKDYRRGGQTVNVAYIMNMYTLPRHRGRGIATELLARLVAHARQKDCARAFLHALANARSIYERAGFLPDDSEMRLDLSNVSKNRINER